MKSISLDTSWIHNTGKMREELKLLHEESASLAPVGVSPFWAHWKVLDQKKNNHKKRVHGPNQQSSEIEHISCRRCTHAQVLQKMGANLRSAAKNEFKHQKFNQRLSRQPQSEQTTQFSFWVLQKKYFFSRESFQVFQATWLHIYQEGRGWLSTVPLPKGTLCLAGRIRSAT